MSGSIFTYVAPFHIYALNWSFRSDERSRLAVSSSVIEHPNAFVNIIRFDPYNRRTRPAPIFSFRHPVHTPNTLAFMPHPGSHHPDLLASSADTLRLWHINGNSVRLRCQLPRTGAVDGTHLRMLDWNSALPRRIITLSTDTTCTVWDIDRQAAEAQLFTNSPDNPVQDVAWGTADVLAAAFTDGTVKYVDLRVGRCAHTIHTVAGGYADRVEFNYIDPHYLAVTAGDARVVVLDARRPEALAVMRRHTATVNTMAWDPHSPNRICTAGDDARALVWEIPSRRRTELVWEIPARRRTELVVEHAAGGMVEQLKWSWLQPEFVAFGFENRVHVVRVR